MICLNRSQCDIVLVDIDECSSFPCMNEGTCIDAVNSYTCACVDGMPIYTGTQCEIGESFVWSNVYKHLKIMGR